MLDDITITVGNWYFSRTDLGDSSKEPKSEITLNGTTSFVKFIIGDPVKISYSMHIKVASSSDTENKSYIEKPKRYDNYTSIKIHAYCNEYDFLQLRDMLIELKSAETLSIDIFLNLYSEENVEKNLLEPTRSMSITSWDYSIGYHKHP
jgi:hypothetical protein